MFSRKQKSFVRNFAFVVMLLCGLLGVKAVQSAQAATLVVTNPNDSGAGSLRQMLTDAVSGDTITFDPSLSGQTITLSSTLVLDKNLTIDGSALASQITISGNNSVRVFIVSPGVAASLKSLIVTNGSTASDGGGVYNQGTLLVSFSRFTSNTAKNDGGAIYSLQGTLAITDTAFDNNNASSGGAITCLGFGSMLTVTNSVYLSNTAHGWSGQGDGGAIDTTCNATIRMSTFSANTASLGGAILTDNDVNPVAVTNSTFYSNTAPTGGGIYNAGQLLVTNSTFSDNNSSDAGAIRNGLGGVLSLRNSILANTVGGVDCSASDSALLAENINNLIETNGAGLQSCGVPLLTSDPVLGPLNNNGNFTQTMALLSGSPAIDTGDAVSCPATDQRGVSRPQGNGCDLGAYEYVAPAPTPCSMIMVTNTNDAGAGSLRQAIANICPGGTIKFDPSLAGQTITLTSNLLINKNLTIDGSGLAPQVTISGGNVAHLEVVGVFQPVIISDLTIANGYTSGNGGAILSSSNLTIINSTLRNNHAVGAGGAILSSGIGLRLENTAIYQNQADVDGGVLAVQGSAYYSIINSTISGNHAGGYGGAIFMNGNAEASIYNSTFAGNSASQGNEFSLQGNIFLYLYNTIFVCTTGSTNCYNTISNVAIDASNNSILGTGTLSDYGVAALADNGGPTRTMALLPGSSLIDAGNDSICANSYVNSLDQRGVTRPQGAHCDIGAYESVPSTPTPTSTPPYSYNPLYLSLANSQTVGGVAAADEDILKFDGTNWSLFFDGSDVGVASPDLFAFSIMDADTILMSFNANVTVNGIAATPQDVLRFDATSLGSTTAGTWSLYFDGSDVGLSDTTNEKIDSLSLLPDGRLLISTTGNPVVPGVSGGRDEDVLAFTPTSLGSNTSGTWSLYFDGSDVGLSETSGEDVDALDVVGNNIYLSTVDNFSVPGLSGADEDVFVCAATSLGDVTACNYSPNLYFDGSTWGLAANDVDAFNFLGSGPTPTVVPTGSATPTPTGTPMITISPSVTSTPTNTPTNTPTPTGVPTSTPSPSLYVHVLQPNGGETLTEGTTYRITWESTPDIDTIYIGYKSCDSCLDWIATAIPNTGYYDWNVKVANIATTQFKIYVLGYDTGVGSGFDMSDNYFTLFKVTPTPTQTATPTVRTFTPVADTYVNAGSAATNYGTSTTLRADASPDVHSYLRFNVQGLTGTVTSATILVYANSSSSAGINVNSVSDNSWSESTLNYNNAPAVGGSLGSVGGFTAPIWIRIDVTGYVTGNGTYNFALTTPGSTAISFASREAGANAPQLVIETTP